MAEERELSGNRADRQCQVIPCAEQEDQERAVSEDRELCQGRGYGRLLLKWSGLE